MNDLAFYQPLFEVADAYEQYYLREMDADLLRQYMIYGFITGANDRYAGYYTAEAQITNSYKPSTSVNGANIDFIFTKPSAFKSIKYKVINDHPLALWTSDHYPVFAKLVLAEEYDDVLLEIIYEYPELPKDPDYNDWGDDFNTEDDTDGFEYN